jgi:hypothetical protein
MDGFGYVLGRCRKVDQRRPQCLAAEVLSVLGGYARFMDVAYT